LKQLGLDQAAFDPTGSLPYFTKCYQIIKELTPFLTDETLKIHSFKKEKDTTYQYQDENYRFLIKYLSKDKKEQLNTAGLFFQLENDYFF
ncbi:DNA recombination protein RuvA, partial [Enterococcus faecium]